MRLAAVVISVLIVLGIIGVIAVVRVVTRAFASAECPETDCAGSMQIERRPYGHDGRTVECFVCNTCGYVESVVPPTRAAV